MIKKYKYLTFFILLFALFAFVPTKVEALPLCRGSIKRALKEKAYKLEFKTELVITESYDYYYKISVSNVEEDLKIKFNGITYAGNKEKNVVQFAERFEPGKTYTFEIDVADARTCAGETVATKSISLKKFNIYSTLDECVEYEEFKLCNENYNGEIKDYYQFRSELDEYIKNKEESESRDYKDGRNIFQKFIDIYVDNIEISVTITALLIIAILAFVINKIINRINRVKLRR